MNSPGARALPKVVVSGHLDLRGWIYSQLIYDLCYFGITSQIEWRAR